MTDLIEEFTDHVQKGLQILLNDFPRDTPGSAVEEIIRGRDARKKLREWQEKFSAVLDAVDDQEQVLRIMPYEAPSKRNGEPAYDMDGLQMLVEVVDGFSQEEFTRNKNMSLNWTAGNPHLANKRQKTKKFYAWIKAVRDGLVEKPEIEK